MRLSFVQKFKFTTVLAAGGFCAGLNLSTHAGPLLNDPVHEVALDALEKIQAASIRDNLEYCGYIGYQQDGTLVATPAKRGDKKGCRLSWKPRSIDIIATYHTHGAHTRTNDSEAPSVQDLKNDFKQRLNGYIATPGGRVWFNDYNNQISRLLCDIGCIETDPNYRECKHTAPEAQYTIEGLKWRGKTVNTPC